MIFDVDTSCPYCESESTRYKFNRGHYIFACCLSCHECSPAFRFFSYSEDEAALPIDIALERAYLSWHETYDRLLFQEVLMEMSDSY